MYNVKNSSPLFTRWHTIGDLLGNALSRLVALQYIIKDDAEISEGVYREWRENTEKALANLAQKHQEILAEAHALFIETCTHIDAGYEGDK